LVLWTVSVSGDWEVGSIMLSPESAATHLFRRKFNDPVVILHRISSNVQGFVVPTVAASSSQVFSVSVKFPQQTQGLADVYNYLAIEKGKTMVEDKRAVFSGIRKLRNGETKGTVHFPELFSTPPSVVITAVSGSKNQFWGGQPRIVSVTKSQFDFVFPQTSSSRVLIVNWVAFPEEAIDPIFFSASVDANDKPIYVSSETINSENNRYVFASVSSNVVATPAIAHTPRFDPAANGISVVVNRDGASSTATEVVSLLALMEKVPSDSMRHTSADIFAVNINAAFGNRETGRVSFVSKMNSPIVILQPLLTGSAARTLFSPLPQKVSSSGFDIRIRNWGDASGIQSHDAPEFIQVMAVERGETRLPDGSRIFAGEVTLNTATGTITFSGFSSPPLILLQPVDVPFSIFARASSVTAGTATIVLASDTGRPLPNSVKVHYVAVSLASGSKIVATRSLQLGSSAQIISSPISSAGFLFASVASNNDQASGAATVIDSYSTNGNPQANIRLLNPIAVSGARAVEKVDVIFFSPPRAWSGIPDISAQSEERGDDDVVPPEPTDESPGSGDGNKNDKSENKNTKRNRLLIILLSSIGGTLLLVGIGAGAFVAIRKLKRGKAVGSFYQETSVNKF